MPAQGRRSQSVSLRLYVSSFLNSPFNQTCVRAHPRHTTSLFLPGTQFYGFIIEPILIPYKTKKDKLYLFCPALCQLFEISGLPNFIFLL